MNRMPDIDRTAREEALKTLSNGKFSWQAYLVLAMAESRLDDPVPDSTVDEKIDSFYSRYVEYARNKGTDRGFVALQQCLSVAVATFSELLATTTGDERAQVMDACRKVSDMVQ